MIKDWRGMRMRISGMSVMIRLFGVCGKIFKRWVEGERIKNERMERKGIRGRNSILKVYWEGCWMNVIGVEMGGGGDKMGMGRGVMVICLEYCFG